MLFLQIPFPLLPFPLLSPSFLLLLLRFSPPLVLKGPTNPYEVSFYPMTQAGGTRAAKVEKSAVNVVVVDSEPQDKHERMMEAAHVASYQCQWQYAWCWLAIPPCCLTSMASSTWSACCLPQHNSNVPFCTLNKRMLSDRYFCYCGTEIF